MDVYVYNTSFELIGIIDNFSSVIVTSRYYEAGDFEIYLKASSKNLELLQPDHYIKYNDFVGIIETINITTDLEQGNYLTAGGRDLKSILDRRIVWQQTNLYTTAEAGIRSLINDNVISPAISDRAIKNFILSDAKGYTDPINLQVTGDTLYETIINICKAYNYGWQITLNDSNQFVFELYKGTDRSYGQSSNNYVVFSPEFENISSTNYTKDKQGLRNVALIAGEGEGLDRITQTTGSASGLNRRELYVDARDISQNKGNDGEITDADYKKLLLERGGEQLAERMATESFEGDVNTNYVYNLNDDYYLGDIVTAVNEYGIAADTRIIEIIQNESNTGYSVIPTFEAWS